jgi:hypothetical protein
MGIAPALAQSTNAAPDLTVTDAPFEAAKLPGLPEAAKQAVANATQQVKSGEWLGYVLAASPDLSVWRLTGVAKTPPVFSLSDVARVTLETCEFESGGPAYILSINGRDTQRRLGGWTPQPEMLFKRPTDFDEREVPFVLASARPQMSAYRRASGNRAFVITTNGGWLSRAGDTLAKAIATAEADCATTFKGATCLLYAVNDRVVFEPR